jgi:hypothetical protein
LEHETISNDDNLPTQYSGSQNTTSSTYLNGHNHPDPRRVERNPGYQDRTDNQSSYEYAPRPTSNQQVDLANPTPTFHGGVQYQTGLGTNLQNVSYPSQTPKFQGYGSHAAQPAFPAHHPTSPYAGGQLHVSDGPTRTNTSTTPINANIMIGVVHRTSNPGFKYVCGRCSQTFTRPQDLDRHYNGAHDPQPTIYWCPIAGCTRGRPFDRHDKMMDHVAAAHRDEM